MANGHEATETNIAADPASTPVQTHTPEQASAQPSVQSPQEFFEELTERADVRELLTRLAKE
jgi:hypothetical protein